MCKQNLSAATERFNLNNVDPSIFGWRSGLNREWQCIQIGSRSYLDRAYVMPASALDYPANIVSDIAQRVELRRDAVLVSVERPFIGSMRGPLIVFSAYANDVMDGKRFTIAGLNTAGFDNAGLDLDLYEEAPPIIATRRAPFERVIRLENFGNPTASPQSITFPGWGRKLVKLTINIAGITAGSLSWDFNGVDIASLPAFADIVSAFTIQPTTTEVADAGISSFFEGEFDFYTTTITEVTALNAGVTVDIIFKAWDL